MDNFIKGFSEYGEKIINGDRQALNQFYFLNYEHFKAFACSCVRSMRETMRFCNMFDYHECLNQLYIELPLMPVINLKNIIRAMYKGFSRSHFHESVSLNKNVGDSQTAELGDLIPDNSLEPFNYLVALSDRQENDESAEKFENIVKNMLLEKCNDKKQALYMYYKIFSRLNLAEIKQAISGCNNV